MEMKELIRQLKRIDEDLTEDTIEDTIEPQQAPEMKTELVDGMSIADKLAAKTKIARALEVLKDAINEFKDASVSKLDMLNDNGLISAIETLDLAVTSIEQALAPEQIEDGGTGLNAAFADELPDEPIEEPAEETEEEDEEDAEDEDTEEADFDSEAEFNLLDQAEEE